MYTISENNSPVVFNRACKKLEEMFPNVKMERAIDVDGSVIQIFNTTLGDITVIDDYDLEEVDVKTDIAGFESVIRKIMGD